jgi:hypothetical protein
MIVDESMLRRIQPKVKELGSRHGTPFGHLVTAAVVVVIVLVLWYRNMCKREGKPI